MEDAFENYKHMKATSSGKMHVKNDMHMKAISSRKMHFKTTST